MDDKKEFMDWDSFYEQNELETMPWYEKNLDKDLMEEIKSMEITKGRFLDVGTGPGTQAAEIAKLGFDTIGIDISKNAIFKARQRTEQVGFVVEDILNSSFADEVFDFILDRGCFHVFEPKQRRGYIDQIKRILKDDGILFLKVMSVEEDVLPENKGPYRFSQQDVMTYFKKDFKVRAIRPTLFYGTLRPLPKAIFTVLQKTSRN